MPPQRPLTVDCRQGETNEGSRLSKWRDGEGHSAGDHIETSVAWTTPGVRFR